MRVVVGQSLVDQAKEIIELRDLKRDVNEVDISSVELGSDVVTQVEEYLKCIAALHHDNPYHSFARAS